MGCPWTKTKLERRVLKESDKRGSGTRKLSPMLHSPGSQYDFSKKNSKSVELKSDCSGSKNDDHLQVQKIDVDTQFNYMSLETDHLQGITISKSKLFCAHDDQPQTLTWDSHGFELHLPVNTCLPGEKCEIMVDAVVGGEFVFPRGVEPVSAIYIISITSKLREPSLLKIQHCVALDKVSKHNDLSFYRALLKEPKPPYYFKCVKGGKFNDQFGELELPAFCAMAIGKGSSSCSTSGDEAGSDAQLVKSNDTSSGFSDIEQEHSVFDREKSRSGTNHSGGVDSSVIYFSQVFYLRMQLNEWKMKFVIVKNIKPFTSYVKDELKEYEKDVEYYLRFFEPSVQLELDEQNSAKGWSIKPYAEPLEVLLQAACSFGYEKEVPHPPCCMVNVYGDNSVENHARRLHHPVSLKGALSGSGTQEPKLFIIRTMAEKDETNLVQIQQGTVAANTERAIPKSVLKKHTAQLVEALDDPDRLTNKLWSEEMIPDQLKFDLLGTDGLTNYKKANRLIDEIYRRISGSSNSKEVLLKFCTVLKVHDKKLEHIASKMEMELYI